MYSIKIRDQVCNVMANLTKTFVSPEIVLQNWQCWTRMKFLTSLRPKGLRQVMSVVHHDDAPIVRVFTVAKQNLETQRHCEAFVHQDSGCQCRS